MYAVIYAAVVGGRGREEVSTCAEANRVCNLAAFAIPRLQFSEETALLNGPITFTSPFSVSPSHDLMDSSVEISKDGRKVEMDVNEVSTSSLGLIF